MAEHGYTPHKEDHLKRLRRIEGQARGLQRMVEDCLLYTSDAADE